MDGYPEFHDSMRANSWFGDLTVGGNDGKCYYCENPYADKPVWVEVNPADLPEALIPTFEFNDETYLDYLDSIWRGNND